MQLKQRINAFIALGNFLKQLVSENPNFNNHLLTAEKQKEFFETAKNKLAAAEIGNSWFTQDNIQFSLESWAEALTEENLLQWVSVYESLKTSSEVSKNNTKTIAIIMAGNIPLVGFHDFLCCLITGNKVLAKLSSNDKVLLPFLSEYLIAIEPGFKEYISFTEEKLENFDAIIATGSNNTSRFFEYYFSKYPHIIRKNRNSVAVLTGGESTEQLHGLADDIFRYFGLGCRNVSKIYVPNDYDFDKFFNAIFSWKEIINNNKYINNYDYNKAVYLMDSNNLLDNEFLLLKEDEGFSSPIAVLFFGKYSSLSEMESLITEQTKNIQCVVSNSGLPNEIAFGQAQHPKLWDYADGVDTVNFLLKLQ